VDLSLFQTRKLLSIIMSKRSRAQKKRSREEASSSHDGSSADPVDSTALSKTQKRKLQKKRQKEAEAKERALHAAAAAAADAPSVKKQKASTSSATVSSQTGLCVVYEDEHMIAISKPAGLLAHGSHSATERGTVVHALGGRQRVPGYSPMPAYMLASRESYTGEADSFIPRAIVHRLDRGTTGLMMVAKSAAAERHLAAHFKQRTTHKRYVALLCGWPNASAPGTTIELDDTDYSGVRPPSGGVATAAGGIERLRVSVPIDRDPARPGKMQAVVPEAASGGGGTSEAGASSAGSGKAAQTLVYIHAYSPLHGGVCLCSMDLLTGRQHQIRVHCSHLGAPLLNDDAYGGGTSGHAASAIAQLGPLARARPLLHAWGMELPKPAAEHDEDCRDGGDGELLQLRAPLPDDMRSAIGRLWPDLVAASGVQDDGGGPHTWPCLSPARKPSPSL
jgi:23S rRNA-/tRNA-specific pseudouridylate synthase